MNPVDLNSEYKSTEFHKGFNSLHRWS